MDCYKSFTFLKSLFTDAVLITGSGHSNSGLTAELYLPSTGISCLLPQLPDDRAGHSVTSSGLLCGGADSNREQCLQWNTGSWDELLTLDVGREDHVSWTPGNGIGTFLMGGWSSESKRTTTLIKPDGTHEVGFPLQYRIR